MDTMFSVEDIPDHLWSSPQLIPPRFQAQAEEESWPSSLTSMLMMKPSNSELDFQRFLQEDSALELFPSPPPPPPPPPFVETVNNNNQDDVVEISPQDNSSATSSFAAGGPPNIATDPEECQAFLRNLLDVECAAVAYRESCVIPKDNALLPDNGSQISNISWQGSELPPGGSGNDLSKGKDEADAGGLLPLHVMQKKSVVQITSSTSGSSGDQWEDNVVEGERGATNDMDSADVKRARRMLSNREAARRSRSRKQAHLIELETEVSRLRVQNSSLLKQLSDLTKKCNVEVVETMRTMIRTNEEMVKRFTGMNPVLQAAGSPCMTSADASVHVQDDPNQHASDNPTKILNCWIDVPPVVLQNPPRAIIDGNKIGRTPSMERMASLEHMQKRINRGGASSCGTQHNVEWW